MIRNLLSTANWPLAIKVPLAVVALMACVATAISYVVLARLAADQEEHLREMAGGLMDGIALAVTPHVLRRDVWETFDVLDRMQGRSAGLTATHVIVALPDRTVLAASDPEVFPVGSVVPDELFDRVADRADLVIDDRAARAWYGLPLTQGGTAIGRLMAEIDIAPLLAVRREVLTTLILVNTCLTLLLAGIGTWLVQAMLRPVGLLSSHVEHLRDGTVAPIPAAIVQRQGTEFGRLFAGFNAMAQAVGERNALAARLADEEKVALLGRLASGMAHEVNNPLGGMMNAVDTLRRHGHDPAVRRQSTALIERGLTGIRDVVRAALVTYKDGAEPTGLARADLDDLRYLIAHETARRRLRLDWHNALPDAVPVDGSAARQVALNLLLNACAATPVDGLVRFEARLSREALAIVVADHGRGIPPDMVELVTSKGTAALPAGGHGLGLWTVARLVGRLAGEITIDLPPDGGSEVTVTLPLASKRTLDAAA